MIPNIGVYSARETDLDRYIVANGGYAGPVRYGGDFFSALSTLPSGVILGISAGGLYSNVAHNSCSIGHANLSFGTSLLTTEYVHIAVLAKASAVFYSVTGVIPPGQPYPPSNSFYLRSYTFGGGPVIQISIKILETSKTWIGLGAETGVTYTNPDVSWRWGYDAVSANGNYTRFRGINVPGPRVDAMLAYVHLALVFKF